MTYAQPVTAVLIDKDATTVITGALDDAFDFTFMDELNGFGTGTCTIQISDPDSDELRRGRFVQILVGGVARFTFKIEGNPQYHQIDKGEEHDEILVFSGRGWGCVFEEAIVYPEVMELVDLDYSYRAFTFASFYFPNDGAWGNSQALYEYLDGLSSGTGRAEGVVDTGADPDDTADDTLKLYPSPIAFPWPNAYHNGDGSAPTPTYSPTYWMIADGATEADIGYHFFRGFFTLAGEQEVKFLVTADNYFTLFLSGTPILGENDDMLMWLGWKEVTLVLPAGFYVVGLVVQNVAADVPYNPGGGLFNAIATAVYPGDVETSLTLALLSSDGGWDSTFSADEWPGWTVGQILDRLVIEANDRGALNQFDTFTFGDFVDSDGNDWNTADPDTTTMFIPSFSTRVGQTYGQVLTALHDEGWLEWHFTPDVLQLDGYAPGEFGTDSGVLLLVPTDPNDPTTGNLVGLERGETRPYANSLFVQWAHGWVTVDDAAEITAYGSRVEDIYSTDCATVTEAARQGRIELQRRMIAENAAIVVQIEPRSSADAPYEAFGLGDYVDVPNATFTEDISQQVLSISLQTDEEGFAVWTMELNERWPALERDRIELLRNVGGKTYGSPSNHGIARD